MKKITLGVIAILLSATLFAAPRTAEEAAAIAAEFTNAQPQLSRMHKAPRKAVNMRLAHTAMQKTSETPAFYVFNQDNGAGYVVVSADDRTATDVLGYSDSGSFDYESINPNYKYWLDRYARQITYLQTIDESKIQKAPAAQKAVQVEAIKPLLGNIKWDQDAPYYDLCPMDKVQTSKHCLTGCVATAASQIMRKWKHPAQGIGTKTYTWEACTSKYNKQGNCSGSTQDVDLTAKFGETTYDWDNMLESYSGSYTTAQGQAVATLMYHAGVACEMAYASVGSGAFTDDMAHGLINYFGYRITKYISMLSKYDIWDQYDLTPHSDVPYEVDLKVSKFVEYFNADLEAGRPVLMGGYTSASGGHEFVCDGRDASGKFHINWGWSGDDNDYFELTALTPGSDDFSDELDAVIGLEPANLDPVAVESVTVSPTSQTIDQKEKLQLTATVLPANATNNKVTWSSDKPAVATVDEDGKVTGVAKGIAVITVTTKDGNKTAQATITVTDQEISVTDCAPYSYTFTKGVSTAWQLGDYYWYINISGGTYTSFDGPTSYDRGAQFGSSSSPSTSVKLSTDDVNSCIVTDVTVNACVANKGSANLIVLINDEELGTKALTTSSADYTFKNTKGLQGALEIQLKNTGTKAMYIKSIKTNTGATTDVENMTINNNAVKRIENGQLVIIVDGHKYNACGQRIE